MKEISLTRGLVALVDDCDFDFINQWKWQASYAPTSRTNVAARYMPTDSGWRALYMHRVIMDAPKGMDVDHRDNNGLNNTRTNLRVCSRAENLVNTRKRRGTSSQYKGVTFDKSRGLWAMSCRLRNGKSVRKRFESEEDAAHFYDTQMSESWGEFVKLNFPVKTIG